MRGVFEGGFPGEGTNRTGVHTCKMASPD